MSDNVADELAKLVALRDSGNLSPEEFEQQKAKLLASGPPAPPTFTPAPVVPAPVPTWPPPQVKKQRHVARWILLGIVALVVVIVIAAVASSGAKEIKTSPSGQTAHVGATLNINDQVGDDIDVTVVKVEDPATDASGGFNQIPAGDNLVAVVITVKNEAASAESDDADTDSTLIGANGQDYTTQFDTVKGCTDFSNGQYNLGPGESQTGCVSFEVPKTNAPTKFQYSPDDGQTFGEWLIG
jgi:Domain of unknown function (DUF4352)/Short C-terminal domain